MTFKNKMEFRFMNKIIMEEIFKSKIDWFSSNYEKEIGGFIIGRREGDNIILEDLIIPKQEVTSGHISFKAKDLVKMRKKHGDRCLKILGEWHSHVNMGCFWSSTDVDEFIEPFSEGRDLSIFVVSSNAKHLIRIELRKPLNISMDKIKYKVVSNIKVGEECLKEIEENVSEAVYSYGGNDWKDTDYSKDWNSKKDNTSKEDNKPKFVNNDVNKISVKHHIDYYGTQNLKLINLSWFVGNALYEEYRKYHPHLTGSQSDMGNFTLKFEFGSKEEAIKMLPIIKKSIAEMIIEEDSLYNNYDGSTC